MRSLFSNVLSVKSEEFLNICMRNLAEEHKMFIVTANPEIFVKAKSDTTIFEILTSSDTSVVSDGIGIVKGGRLLGYQIPERITGVDLTHNLLEYINQKGLKLYLYGAAEDILEKLIHDIGKTYPNIKLVGSNDGYVKNQDVVKKAILESEPDLCLVALGVPAQELFIADLYPQTQKGVFIGVGGTFDVLSGAKKRAPNFYIRWNIEWLYRIVKEPQRIRRFIKSNVSFMFSVIKAKIGSSRE